MQERVSIALLAANLIGVIVYLYIAGYSWAIPEERGLNSQTGEAFLWVIGALPVLAFFFFTDLIWAVFVLAKNELPRRLWAAAAVLWIVAVIVDFSRH